MISVTWALFALLLTIAAVSDLRRYRIPNFTVLGLIGLFLVSALYHWNDINWQAHLVSGAVCFVVTVVLYACRVMGAGDAKLLATVGLWSGLTPLAPFLFCMSVAGLVLVFVLMALRRLFQLEALADASWMPRPVPRVLRVREGVPYGVAIAVAAVVTSGMFPHWLWTI